MQLAMDEINAAGGIGGKQVVADFYDDEGKPESAASAMQKITGDPDVFAVVGHVNSSCTLAGLPIYTRAGLTEISGDSSNPTITHQGYKNFFRTLVNDALAGPATMKYAASTLGKKKLGIIYENTDYGKGLMDASTPIVQQLGAQVVDGETYTMGTDKDFSAQLWHSWPQMTPGTSPVRRSSWTAGCCRSNVRRRWTSSRWVAIPALRRSRRATIPGRSWRSGVDIGGSFTDLLLVETQSGHMRVSRVLTAANNPAAAVNAALRSELRAVGVSAKAYAGSAATC